MASSEAMPDLTARERARLPDSAFAYVDAQGRRLLPIHDEAHVRNALARFNRTHFEDDSARDRARRRLLKAARRHGIVPDGFITAQLEPQRRLPRGQVCLLLTDVEGSTELLDQLGEAYADLLTGLRRLIRREVKRAGGHEVDARADEFFAAFSSTQSALLAALAIQRALGVREWPGEVVPRLRMGLHSGRPSVTAAGYVGMAVHAAARVCSAAHGGQVVLSRAAAYSLGEDNLPAAVQLRSLGEFRLYRLPQPIELFQVVAEDLPTDFPPPRV